MRSRTCKGSNGQFLEEYHNETVAKIAAEELQNQYGKVYTPYLCRSCNYWHLRTGSARRQCHLCMDANLFHKDVYPTQAEAQSTVAYLKKEKRVQLYVYRCPHGSGWHLTKKGYP